MIKAQKIVITLLACGISSQALAADLLGDWPTKVKTASGVEYGVKGLYQYDLNNFSGDALDPATHAPLFDDAHTWRRKEFDAYLKAPNGLELDLGYDWSASWTDNYLKYSSPAAGDFRVGQFKTQVGWESTESASASTFLEPSLPGNAAYEGRRLGIDWSYDRIPHWLLAAAYYAGGDLDGQHDGHGYSGRVVYAPIATDTNVVHLGIAASRELPDDHIAQFSSPPEAGLTQTELVDTSKLHDTRSIDRIGLEAGVVHGPLYAQGEYLHATAHRTDATAQFTGNGYYVFGAWMLTGESRAYKDGYFVNTQPAHAFGAIELALRYSELDLGDGPVRGGQQHDWTLGMNWYVGQHLKLQADYVWAHADDSPANAFVAPIDPKVFELRAQVYF